MENEDLWAAAAKRLVWHKVEVRWRRPAIRGLDGQAYRTPNGRLVIDVRPDLSAKNTLYVFCHELAHLKLKHPTQDNPDQAPGSVTFAPGLLSHFRATNPQVKKLEAEANAQAGEWLEFAEANYKQFGSRVEGVTTRKLKALCSWWPAEIKGAIERGAARGATAAVKSYLDLESWKREQERIANSRR